MTGAFIAEAASSPAAALLTDRFSLNGDVSGTDLIGDHTLRRRYPRLPGRERSRNSGQQRAGRTVLISVAAGYCLANASDPAEARAALNHRE
jgi:hypothetical protein